MSIQSEQIFEDGGYSATVQCFGQSFAVHYVNHEIRVHGLVSQYTRTRNWKFQGAAKKAKELVAARIAELGTEFQSRHAALYAE